MPEVILVIEDEPGIVNFLEYGLAAQGFEVRSATDGITGAERAIGEDVDLVELDMMLPGLSGRVTGLDCGAVDYLIKPFAVKELAARIRAHLRVAAQTTTVRHRGRVLSRRQILRAVLGYDRDPGTNLVDVYIGYVRCKLGNGGPGIQIRV